MRDERVVSLQVLSSLTGIICLTGERREDQTEERSTNEAEAVAAAMKEEEEEEAMRKAQTVLGYDFSQEFEHCVESCDVEEQERAAQQAKAVAGANPRPSVGPVQHLVLTVTHLPFPLCRTPARGSL